MLEPEEWTELESSWNRFALEARPVKFVPASGAATRMFAFAKAAEDAMRASGATDLAGFAASGELSPMTELLDRLDELPFSSELERAALARGTNLSELRRRPLDLIGLLTKPDGLALASLPKGLIPFHRYGSESRTALEEHLREAALYVRGQGDTVTVHLTVSPEHRRAFETEAERAARLAGAAHQARYEIEFSTQNPATDTLSLGSDSAPVRNGEGLLVFRPAGHGALLDNLGGLDAEVVFVKNVDNVAPSDRHPKTAAWKRRLGGHLLRLRRDVFALLDRLETPADDRAVRDALDFLQRWFALRISGELEANPPHSIRALLLERLDRPLRVAGMVPNQGEPGGGPFWTATSGGFESGQIVEGSQVDHASASQVAIFESSTHFNPVDLVCSLRDRRGRPYDLATFIDPDASFVAEKHHGGRAIRALERPGLWNGAMAHWNTAFVEVPLSTFTPVKTLLDLLRPEHRTQT